MDIPKFLDCTLRDGGYYTDWDFDRKLVERYILSLNQLPVDYVEVGYRTNELAGYAGEYRYLPVSTLKWIKEIARPELKIAVMLDEKDVSVNDLEHLIAPITEYCDMVRMAVAPERIASAIALAQKLKEYNLEVGINIMYMSKVQLTPDVLSVINENAKFVDYFYLVDSFGGVTPEVVKEKISYAVANVESSIGFHGHNNMELGLANSISAVESGAKIIDGTITGMGRGAGNLKTELFLTYLQSKAGLEINYKALLDIVSAFEELQKTYKWGTNLPYMISGANSLPQKDVMSWMGKKRYSVNAIVQALTNQSKREVDNMKLPEFSFDAVNFKGKFDKIVIVGGGKTVHSNITQIKSFLVSNPDILVIHSSARNIGELNQIPNNQLMCLTGNEGVKLAGISAQNDLNTVDAYVFPPYPRQMGTFIPSQIVDKSYQLKNITFVNDFYDAPLAISLQIVLDWENAGEVILLGFDGYNETLSENAELRDETQFIIDSFAKIGGTQLVSYTPTQYKNVNVKSFYAYL